jgi:hypothetical protein
MNNPDTIREQMPASDSIALIDERSLKEKIYIVRGVQVMLDFELADIYGYETRYFNRQVQNNLERFQGDDFMFQLTKEEFDILKCKFFTSSWGGRRKLPYAFTEQGIYMLMTVLRGELAIKQSRTLIRLFKSMKDYIIENQQLLIAQKDYYALAERVENNSKDIEEIKDKMITRADLSGFMKLFDQSTQNEEILILDGHPFKADIAYQNIYRSAKKSIIVIDDYIGVKTLHHLVHANPGVKLTIISDNKLRILKLSEYQDFLTEYPSKTIDFIKSKDRAHDRYIVIDNDTTDMKVYHCGASSKDAGKRITTITRLSDVNEYKKMIATLLGNDKLVLR